MNWKSNKKGFTGIQIIIVILLIGIVVGASYVIINSNREKGKESKEETTIQNKDIRRERDIKRDNTEIGIRTDNKEEEKKIDIANQIVDNIQPIKRAIRLPSYKSVVNPGIVIPSIPNTPNIIITPIIPTPIIPIIPPTPPTPPTPPLPPVILGAGERDTTFDTGVPYNGFNNYIYTSAIQADGKILLGGGFTKYQGVKSNGLIRLNIDGTKDNSFNIGDGFYLPNSDNDSGVGAITVQSDGKILVGGYFTEYNGEIVNRIVRLNSDGSRDAGFNTMNAFTQYSEIYSIVTQNDGKILVGGVFTEYNGETVNHLIRLNNDGARDTSFQVLNGFDDHVINISIQSDGKILVGGYFNEYNGEEVGYGIIRLNSDGGHDISFDTENGFNDGVLTLTQQADGKILVGGFFTQYKGETANRIIRLNSDGSRDTSFDTGTGFNSGLRTFTIQTDGKIIVGGSFESYKDKPAAYLIRVGQ